ncbi:MAG: polyphenol oxidase family protein, partial [Acetatifactor sp.]|nr:polyphenol oxidase family protein [Acetatifactor sp.]
MLQPIRNNITGDEGVRLRQADITDEGNRYVLDYLTFPKLEEIEGISHLFTTRTGGVSEGIFSSLNLSFSRGDDPECVHSNFEHVAYAMGCSVENMVLSKQTHTTNIRLVTSEDCGKGIIKEQDYTDVDGL